MKGKEIPGYCCWWVRHQFTYVRGLERIARRKAGYRPLFRDPTMKPPPSYSRDRADEVYAKAFQRAFEYLITNPQGDIYEFGTFRGYTSRLIALHMVKFKHTGTLRLFDSFIGLPEPSGKDLQSYEVSGKVWLRGAMEVEPDVVGQIQAALGSMLPGNRLVITKGYFDQTLPTLDVASLRPAILLHLDCDLYESTICVLRYMLKNNLVTDGMVMMCDDYNCNRAQPKMGQRLALTDAFREFPRYSCSPWFSYGWHGQAFFLHDLKPAG